jgi:Predicted metal-dependent hydrolase with the TIM-barrel fold
MDVRDGITYMHEHITIDLSGIKKDMDCRLDTMDETIGELKNLKRLGVSNILDVTNRGMGRNMECLLKVREETGMNIIPSTGYYKEPFLPDEVYSLTEKELAKIMVDEILSGIDGTCIKAEVIGEIGTGKGVISEMERKVLNAAADTHVETGKVITTHTTLGTLGIEQIELFKECGVNLEKVIIGHVDLSGDIEYILRLLDSGVYVAFDTIGKINYMPEGKRLDMLKEICKRGLSGKVVMSMDITRKTHLKSRGGLGYGYLLESFVPFIKENGISQEDIDNMLIKNPVKLLGSIL